MTPCPVSTRPRQELLLILPNFKHHKIVRLFQLKFVREGGRAKPPMPQQPHRGISTKFPWKQFHVQLRHFKPICAQTLAWPYTFENVDDEIFWWKVLPFPDILGICTVLDKSGCYRSSSMNLMLYSTKSAPSSFEIGLSKSIFEMYFRHDNKLTSKLISFKNSLWYSLNILAALF